MKNFIFKIVSGAALVVAASLAPAVVVEGFETSNPFGWVDAGSPSPQTQNKAAAAAVTFVSAASVPAAALTEGLQAGRFDVTWTVPGAVAVHPAYLPGSATTFWSLRINAPGGPSQASIPHSATLEANIFNYSADTYQFMFTLLTTDGLKNLPAKTLAPGANTVSWDLSTLTTTGNGVLTFTGTTDYLDGTSSKIRGLFIYNETAPTGPLSIDIDNINLVTTQTDFTAPATPNILSVSQGAAAGELIVKWAANTEPDLAKYNVYLGTNTNFSTPIANRLSVPSTPVAVVNAPATQTTLTGVDTSQPVYIRVSAIDNATPSANESLLGVTLGAQLDPSGATPKDLVVLDYDRYLSSETNFNQNGYAHGIVYYAQALQTKGRTFASANADAVENGSVALAVNANSIVYWGNALDGETVPGEAVNAAAQTALTTYVNAGGNLMISGSALGEDLVTNGTGATFFNNILSATLVAPSVATAAGENNTGNFLTLPATFATGTDVFNVAGFTTTDNESYTANGAAVGALGYVGVTGASAAVLNDNTTVLLGFGFESVRDVTTNPTSDFAAARATRDAMLSDIVDYLLAAGTSDAGRWSMYQ